MNPDARHLAFAARMSLLARSRRDLQLCEISIEVKGLGEAFGDPLPTHRISRAALVPLAKYHELQDRVKQLVRTGNVISAEVRLRFPFNTMETMNFVDALAAGNYDARPDEHEDGSLECIADLPFRADAPPSWQMGWKDQDEMIRTLFKDTAGSNPNEPQRLE